MMNRFLIFVATGNDPFKKVQNVIDAFFGDITKLLLSIFGLGMLILGILLWRGSEENVPRFQKALGWTIVAFVFTLIVKVVLGYVKEKAGV